MENLPYIFPQWLSQEELYYEAFIRGIAEPETFTREALCRLVRQYQLQERRAGCVVDTMIGDIHRETNIIMNAMAEISSEHSRDERIAFQGIEVIRNRLIHLMNRARRIATKTRTQKDDIAQIIASIVAAIDRWGPRETPIPDMERTIPTDGNPPTSHAAQEFSQGAPPSNHHTSDMSELARMFTPEPATPEHEPPSNAANANDPTGVNQYVTGPARQLFNAKMPANSTPTQSRKSNDHMQFERPPTMASTIRGPPMTTRGPTNRQPLPSALKVPGVGSQSSKTQQIRFDEGTQHQVFEGMSDRSNPQQVQQYLGRMAQAYSHAAQIYAATDRTADDSSRTEHQRLVEKIQSLWADLQTVQTAIDSMGMSENQTAFHPSPESIAPSRDRPTGHQTAEPAILTNNIVSSTIAPRADQPIDDMQSVDPEETVFRHHNNTSQFAIRKQISPDRWSFTFSGEEKGNKRDTTPQNFLAQLESNRVAEGYTKATMLTFMNVLLTGIAQTWWTLNRKKMTTYDEFIVNFKREYFPEDFETNAFIDLCAYKQKEEPVMQYLTMFQTRASYCDPYPSEAQLVSILKRNVREEFQMFLVLKKPLTFVDVKRACKEKAELDARNVTMNKIFRSENKPRNFEKPKPRNVYSIEMLEAEEESVEDAEPTEYEICYLQTAAATRISLFQLRSDWAPVEKMPGGNQRSLLYVLWAKGREDKRMSQRKMQGFLQSAGREACQPRSQFEIDAPKASIPVSRQEERAVETGNETTADHSPDAMYDKREIDIDLIGSLSDKISNNETKTSDDNTGGDEENDKTNESKEDVQYVEISVNAIIFNHSPGDRRPFIRASVDHVEVDALLDSGAMCTVISGELAQMIDLDNATRIYGPYQISTADSTKHRFDYMYQLPFQFMGQEEMILTIVLPGIGSDAVLGMDFWDKFNITININAMEVEEIEESCPVSGEHELTDEQKRRLREATSTMPASQPGSIGKTSILKHTIDTGDARPIRKKAYVISPYMEIKVNQEIERMLGLDVIEPADSAWNNPMVTVKKANGKLRYCIDARGLNEVTKPDAYPLPNLNRILARLSKTKYLSAIDLSDAFWQIELDEKDRPKTAFTVTGRGFFQFKRMPFGLRNSAATLCKLIDRIVGEDLEPKIFRYLDDFIIATETFEEHITMIEELAKRLRKAGLTISLDKSKFCKRELRFVGYLVDEGGIRPDPEKTVAVLDFPVPDSVKKVRSFHGMASWYRRFIPNFAEIAAPLTELTTKKNAKSFGWDEAAQRAFDGLKIALTTAPILAMPTLNGAWVLETDASDYGMGGCLKQIQDGEARVIAYFSKKLS